MTVPALPVLLDTKTAARFLRDRCGVVRSPGTLRKLRCVGGGPTFRKFGRGVVYTPDDLTDWAARCLSGPMHSTTASQTTRAELRVAA